MVTTIYYIEYVVEILYNMKECNNALSQLSIHAITDCFCGGREADCFLFAYSYHLLSDLPHI